MTNSCIFTPGVSVSASTGYVFNSAYDLPPPGVKKSISGSEFYFHRNSTTGKSVIVTKQPISAATKIVASTTDTIKQVNTQMFSENFKYETT